MKTSSGLAFLAVILIMSVTLTSCAQILPSQLSAATRTATPTVAAISSTILPRKTSTVTPTPSSALTLTQPVAQSPLATMVPNASTPVLRFVFPTPGSPAKSAWRPALYTVPWAISPYDHFYFDRPIAVNEVNWPVADYRYGAVWPGMDNVIHTGIDIDAPKGTPVLAAGSGKVVWVGYGLVNTRPNMDDPYGLAIVIKHNFGYQGARLETVYAHLSRADVVLDQEVTTGQQIGLVGDTGLTTGPHLHFEIRVEYSNYYYMTRNPELWIVPPQGWGVLAGRIMRNSWTLLYAQDVYVRSVATGDTWLVRTYANSPAVHEDDNYHENFVLSDLPAGDYEVYFWTMGYSYKKVITIHPGMVTFLRFDMLDLFSTAFPAAPIVDFLATMPPASP